MSSAFFKSSQIVLAAIFVLFLLPRVISLGSDIANYDARHWYPRMRNFVEALQEGNWRDTYQKYHPGVTLMWVSGWAQEAFETVAEIKVGRDLQYESKYFPLRHFIVKFPLVFITSILGVGCFYLIWKLTNSLKYAFLWAVFLSLEPFFLGVSRFLHLSALTAMFGFASFLCLLAALEKVQIGVTLLKGLPLFSLSSILLGLAVLTKVDGAIFGVASVALILFKKLGDSPSSKDYPQFSKVGPYLKLITLYSLFVTFTFFLLFPAMWVDPVGVIRQMLQEGFGDTAFAGTGAERLVPFHWLYYFEAFILRSLPTTVLLVPLGLLLSLLSGRTWQACQVRPDSGSNRFGITKFVQLCFIPLLCVFLFLSIPNKTKDRYLVMFSPMLAVLAAYGFYKLWGWLAESNSAALRWGKIGMVGGLVVVYGLTFYRYHPSYSFYYNDLIGGPRGVEKLGLTVKIRGEHYAPAALFLNQQDPEIYNRNAIFLDREQEPSFRPFFQGSTYDRANAMPKDFQRANYFVVRAKYLHRVPEECNLIKEFGVRPPFPYTAVWVFDCGEEVDNTYKYD